MHEDGAPANAMELLFELSPRGPASLQQQLREQIAAAILDGHIAPGLPLPSSRKLSEQLGIGRNTVMLAYSALEEDGYLIARERSGYYVNPEVLQGRAETGGKAPAEGLDADRPDWKRALIQRPSEQVNIRKPANWRDFEYCFIYGQLDPAMFPLRHWRECWRDAARVPEIGEWSVDRYDSDDPLLIEQIRTRLLPRRGVWADESQVLVTVGAQQALFLGYVPGRTISQPSFKFLSGMTCRSCHTRGGEPVIPAADVTPDDHIAATAGTPASCGACHRPEYGRIPAWWSQGGRQRVAAVRSYLERAERSLGESMPDTASVLLGRARSAVELVGEAGVQHNLELGDRVLRESLDHIGLAYRLSAQFPPAAPDLGTPARRWFCSSCHYPIGQPAITGTMPSEPHAELRRKLERQWVDPATEPPLLPQ